MNIGIVGFGKLGGAMGVAIAHKGYRILANDLYPERVTSSWPYEEKGYDGYTFAELRNRANIRYASFAQIVNQCELIFVVVQTPHEEQHDGTHLLGEDRADFDYGYLEQTISDLNALCVRAKKARTIAVVSTVLPGTIRKRILPLCDHSLIDLVYNPAFPAMSTAVRDYLCPEFVLLGLWDSRAGDMLREFYHTITKAPQLCTGYATAETIKMLYNTFISNKIAFANAAMELCHKLGANVDDVSRALGLATKRVVSPAYLHGGMGDGGACHPRDLIAMSWLAQGTELSYDLFGALAEAREAQAGWLCELIDITCAENALTPFIMGTAFKAESNLEAGSAALLCKRILRCGWDEVPTWDPVVGSGKKPERPHVFLIGCNHAAFKEFRFPEGSAVVDPWRYIPYNEGVKVIGVGR